MQVFISRARREYLRQRSLEQMAWGFTVIILLVMAMALAGAVAVNDQQVMQAMGNLG